MSNEKAMMNEELQKTCKAMDRLFIGEEDIVKEFCKENGVYYYINNVEESIDIISKSGKWKIVVDNVYGNMCLYHKNTNNVIEKCDIPGYHLHVTNSNYIIEYFMHIVEHDKYREENPLYKCQIKKTIKGSKKWNKMQKRARKMRRIQKIRYVNNLLDSIDKVV